MTTTSRFSATPAVNVSDIRSSDDVDAMAHCLYGPGYDARRPAVVHVTAVWRRRDSALITLKIQAGTPKSEHDFFVLNLCRARADAIVTSGKILRAERDLHHDLTGPGQVADALASWRRRLGKSEPPISLVLSSGRGLNLDHPLFRSGTRPLVYTSPEGRERLANAGEHGVEVVADTTPSLRSAIDFLRNERQAATIAIESGPSTSIDLYQPPLVVDELLLSIYEEELDEALQGGAFLSRKDIEAQFARPETPFRVRSESGCWSFHRYLHPA